MSAPDYNTPAAFVPGEERAFTLPGFEFEAGGPVSYTHLTLPTNREV